MANINPPGGGYKKYKKNRPYVPGKPRRESLGHLSPSVVESMHHLERKGGK